MLSRHFTPGESSISERIFTFDQNWNVVVDPGPGPYFPIWQSSPVLPEPRDLVNYNVLHYPQYGKFIDLAANTGQITIGGLDTAPPGDITHPELSTSSLHTWLALQLESMSITLANLTLVFMFLLWTLLKMTGRLLPSFWQ